MEDQLRMQSMIEEIAVQHKRLEVLSLQQQKVKKNLVLFKFVKIIRERTDVYFVAITVTKDPEEVEMLSGERMNPKNSHFGSFLVVGIILPTTFHHSLVENKFNMNLSVQFNDKRLCRQVLANKEHTFVVIPWTEFPTESEIDISIFGKVNDKKVVFRIPTIELNISYFIRPLDYSKNVPAYGTYKNNLLEMSRLYRYHKKSFYKDYKFTYTMILPSKIELLDVLLKNFPHLLKKFQKTEDYKFEVLRDSSMPSQVNLKINKNFLEIHSNVRNLYELKRYFVDVMYYNDIKERSSLMKFLTVADDLIKTDYKVAYNFLRKLWQME